MSKRWDTLTDAFTSGREALAIMLRASRRATIVSIVLAVIISVLPTVVLLVQRYLIDEVVSEASNATHVLTFTIVVIVGVYAILVSASETLTSALDILSERLRDKVLVYSEYLLLSKVLSFAGLDLHEDPAQLDNLRLARQGIRGLQSLSWSLFAVTANMIAIIPLLFLTGNLTWWIPVVIIASVAPGIYLQMSMPAREWKIREELASLERQRELWYQSAVDSSYAKDTRLFSASAFILGRWHEIASVVVDRLSQARLILLRNTVGLSFLFGLGLVFPLIFVVNSTLEGQSSTGDLVLLIGSIQAFRMSIWTIIGNAGDFTNALRGVSKFRLFLDQTPPIVEDPQQSLTSSMTRAVMFDRVTFSYPGTQSRTLQDFSMTINRGERIALVGENGAGKSTIAKLLGRLFDPQSGKVTWDGTDIRDFSLSSYRSKLAYVPQDFAEYPFTLRENLAIGRLHETPDESKMMEILNAVDLGALLDLSDLGLDIPLTKELDGGTQLSGGQWQRIAIARAMIRVPDVDLVIMDEPTSALDPIAEVSLTKTMLEMATGKTSLIVSHRLGICTLVDRVIVLHDGQIVETGSHAELMRANGRYAEMFRTQAEWYLGDHA